MLKNRLYSALMQKGFFVSVLSRTRPLACFIKEEDKIMAWFTLRINLSGRTNEIEEIPADIMNRYTGSREMGQKPDIHLVFNMRIK